MNIAHFETSMNWGGQELRIIEQIEWLLQHGHKSWLIARPGSAILKEAQSRDLPCLELRVRGSIHPKTLKPLLTFLRQNQVEILDCHGSRDATYGMFVKWLTNIAVIRSRHVTTPIRDGWLRNLVWKRGCHGIITTADKVNQLILEKGLAKANKIYTAIPGVSETRFNTTIDGSELRAEYGIPADAIVIANVGMIRPDKGQLYFVDACDKLMDRYDNLYAIHMGEATSETKGYKQQVELRIAESNHKQRIQFLGYHHDIENYLAMADMVVVASTRVEAQTRLVTQAYLMNKNVVATNIGGLPEMIKDGETGLLCQPECGDALKEQIERLLADKELAKKLRDNAYRHAHNHMTFDRMMEEMLEQYQRFSA